HYDRGFAGTENRVGELGLAPRQTQAPAAIGLTAHPARLADTESDKVGRTGQVDGGSDAADVVAVDLDAAGMRDVALRPSGVQTRWEGHHLVGTARGRPRTEHFPGRIGEWAEHRDAPWRLGDRQ